jgi:hypothetical protein
MYYDNHIALNFQKSIQAYLATTGCARRNHYLKWCSGIAPNPFSMDLDFVKITTEANKKVRSSPRAIYDS